MILLIVRRTCSPSEEASPPCVGWTRARLRARFVFVQPKLDMKAPKPPDRADPLTGSHRRAPEQAPKPDNVAVSRGNTPERVETSLRPRAARVRPDPPQASSRRARHRHHRRIRHRRCSSPAAAAGHAKRRQRSRPASGGSLGEALRNLQRYVQSTTTRRAGAGSSARRFSSIPKASSSVRGFAASWRRSSGTGSCRIR